MAGIYIHIPFCKQACHYCDFHFSTTLKNKQQLVNALCKELALRKMELVGEIETINGAAKAQKSTVAANFYSTIVYI